MAKMIKAEFVGVVTDKGYAEYAELFKLERIKKFTDFRGNRIETDHVVVSYVTSRTRPDIPHGVEQLALFPATIDGETHLLWIADVNASGMTAKKFLKRNGIKLK